MLREERHLTNRSDRLVARVFEQIVPAIGPGVRFGVREVPLPLRRKCWSKTKSFIPQSSSVGTFANFASDIAMSLTMS